MSDVFISYSSVDKEEIVIDLVKKLEEKGLEVSWDSNQVLPGDNILEAVKKGISESVCTILIITPSYLNSFWGALEIGMTISKESMHILLPVLCGVSKTDIANRFPNIITQKYIELDIANIDFCVKEIYTNIEQLKLEHRNDLTTLLFKKAVKNFSVLDTPITNTVSILLSEYQQIIEINKITAIMHTSQIATTIINDLYEHLPKTNAREISLLRKLDLLKISTLGLNDNIYEHFKLLCKVTSEEKQSLFTNACDGQKLVEMSMTAILEWYTQYLLHNKIISKDKFEIVWPDELTYDDFVTMYEIDKLVLRPDLIATPDITYRWYEYNNYSHIAIRNIESKKIIGYFTVLPVTEQLYKDIQSGYFKDNDLDTENLRKYDVPDFYKLYIACVCIHPQYQNTSAFHMLYNSLIKMMMELAIEREIYITDIITEASTTQGEKLCKILGLKCMINTELDTKIYGATLLPPSWQLKSVFGNKLIKYYKEKYEDLKELF